MRPDIKIVYLVVGLNHVKADLPLWLVGQPLPGFSDPLCLLFRSHHR